MIVPSSVDLSANLLPAFDQGKLGSCTANAIAATIAFNYSKQNKLFIPSRLFLYYNERYTNKVTEKDSGTSIRDGIKSVSIHGVCAENLCPYIPANFTKKPTQEAYDDAQLHKITEYTRLDNRFINDLKTCLIDGFPFICGVITFDSLESRATCKTGIMPLPKPHERCLGGHAALCIGYDDTKQSFLVRNSRGPLWGINGNFWMPYEYMTSINVIDCWVIKS